MITLQNCKLCHHQSILLTIDHLHIVKGETLIIIGESGAGKSLLSKVLLNRLPKHCVLEGAVTKSEQVTMAYMVQNPMSMFNSFQTIYSHFDEMIRSHNAETIMTHKEQWQMVEQSLQEVGLDKQLLLRYPFECSGGQLQRLMFALSLYIKANIYILDEPTSALDTKNTRLIIEWLTYLKREGRTLVIVTHDYQLAKELADKVLVIKSGEVYEYDTAEAIFSSQDSYIQMLMHNPYKRLVE